MRNGWGPGTAWGNAPDMGRFPAPTRCFAVRESGGVRDGEPEIMVNQAKGLDSG